VDDAAFGCGDRARRGPLMGAELMAQESEERQRRVRRSALLWLSVAAAFYFGYIVLTLVRAAR
jgi:hypothetical protein